MEPTFSNELIKNSNAKDGDLLLLTKPLGTGILYNALKKGLARVVNNT